MRNTSENSIYHREENVFIHTMMVCEWYHNHAPTRTDYYYLGLFAGLLHDIAKPICRTRKENEKRGVYYSYDRHDVVGAKMAEELLASYAVNEFEIMRISWMVGHHQIFWSTKDNGIKVRMAKFLREQDIFEPFKHFMLADDFGRICEDRTLDSVQHFDDFEREYMNR
jgi:putative nucleotidyltransferase with HDIG domain